MDWSDETLAQAKRRLDGLYQALRDLEDVPVIKDQIDKPPEPFVDALLDDLNTPKALAELSALTKGAHTAADKPERSKVKTQMIACGELLGILQEDPESWFAGQSDDLDTALIDRLIAERNEARRAKNFDKADTVRDELHAMGVAIEDGPEGTRWRRI